MVQLIGTLTTQNYSCTDFLAHRTSNSILSILSHALRIDSVVLWLECIGGWCWTGWDDLYDVFRSFDCFADEFAWLMLGYVSYRFKGWDFKQEEDVAYACGCYSACWDDFGRELLIRVHDCGGRIVVFCCAHFEILKDAFENADIWCMSEMCRCADVVGWWR